MRPFMSVGTRLVAFALVVVVVLAVSTTSVVRAGSAPGGSGDANENDITSWVAGTTVAEPNSKEPVALMATFGERDMLAALEAIQFALTRVGDGATFVWRRPASLLQGSVRPTSSFRDATGKICRHIVFSMTHNRHSAKIESIACRDRDRTWSLGG